MLCLYVKRIEKGLEHETMMNAGSGGLFSFDKSTVLGTVVWKAIIREIE